MRRFIVLSVLVTWAARASTVGPVEAQDPVLRAPVDAEILDPFRVPSGPYGAGNRGIEYDAGPGDPVYSAGPGTVVFAGPVGGVVYVSVDHGDGLRTSYGPLAHMVVSLGDNVQRGDRLATAVGPLHFSTRIDGTYVDPASLLGVRRVDVRLVPHQTDDRDRVLAAAELGERHALFDLVQSQRGSDQSVRGLLGRVTAIIHDAFAPSSLITGFVAHAEILMAIAPEVAPAVVFRRTILGLINVANPPPCTDEATVATLEPPPVRRIAVVIDGLDSSTVGAGIRGALDLGGAGYDSDDVVRFSYNGGLAPGGGHLWGTDLPRSAYRPEATHAGIEDHIDRFAELLVRIRDANPGVPIDVYGHSLGGVVARHAIADVNDVVDVSVAVTLGSPHRGAPVATVLDAARHRVVGGVIGEAISTVDPDHVLVSPIVADLSERGFAGVTADVAFPESVHAVTIGGRSDVAVPASLASAPGADHHVVVGGLDPISAHDEVAGLPEVHREVRLALAGLDPACTGVRDQILDLVVPESIALTQWSAAGAIIVGSRSR